MDVGRRQANDGPRCRTWPQPSGEFHIWEIYAVLNHQISNVVAGAAESNPCSLYFLNVLLDTTIGVLIFYVFLKGLTWLLTAFMGKEGFVSGQYGNPPNPILYVISTK
jgi:hypothetical protein